MAACAGLLLFSGAAPSRAQSGAPEEAEEAPLSLPAPTTPRHVDFTSDHFDYARSSGVIHLKGHVRLAESTWTIRSDEVWLDLAGRRAKAAGLFQLDEGTSLLSGESGEFDFNTHEGFARGASAGYAPWRIHGEEATVDALRRLHYRRAWFTSCDLDSDPHYHFQAGSVRVRPNKYLLATNVLLYLGNTPVFYTPFLWKSLRKKHLFRARVSPGYDRRNGVMGRTTTLFSVSPAMQGKLFLDYYGAQGLGTGSEVQFKKSEQARGALYGYRIREKRGGVERWAVLGDHYQALPAGFAVHGRLQTQSDADFNNHYTRSNAFRVTQQLVNGAALARSTPLTTTRLSYSRLDVEDPASRRFLKTAESSPRLEFRTVPLAWRGSKTLQTINAFADNSFDAGRGFQQKSLGAGWQGARTFPILRGLSLAPRAGYSETYEDRRDVFTDFRSTRTYLDAVSGRWSAGGTLRLATPAGDWDLGHDYGRRFKPGTFQDDAGAPDYGVETNLLSLGDAFQPHPKVFTRLKAGYDFRSFRDRSVGFRERVQPFTADVAWLASGDLSITARDDYQLQEGNRSFLLQTDWGERGKRFLGLGAAQNLSNAGHYFLSQEFSWTPAAPVWSVSGTLRCDLRSTGGMRFNSAQLYEKELSVRRDFHDFRARAVFRVRPGGIKEAQFRIELLLDRERDIWDKQLHTDYTGRR